VYSNALLNVHEEMLNLGYECSEEEEKKKKYSLFHKMYRHLKEQQIQTYISDV